MLRVESPVEVRRLSPAGEHFFFGYYDRRATGADGRRHLALRVPFIDRPNTGADAAELGVLDLERGGEWDALEFSPAWNWQMGSCAEFLDLAPAGTFVHNAREGRRLFARLRHVRGGVLREYARPIYDSCLDGSYGISLNYARLHGCRPGYGYPDADGADLDRAAPDDDGLWRVDLATGKCELIVSLARVLGVETPPGARGTINWFNHVMISPRGTRLHFLHRWRESAGRLETRLFACRPDGSGLTLVNPGPGISHCDWLDEERILAWCQWRGSEWRYRLMDLAGGEPETVGGGLFEGDGHCSFLPGSAGRWVLTDTYPDREEMRTLILFDRLDGVRHDLGRFLSPGRLGGEIRCDLHPRWDAPRRQVTFDSVHEGFRGIYSADLRGLLAGPATTITGTHG